MEQTQDLTQTQEQEKLGENGRKKRFKRHKSNLRKSLNAQTSNEESNSNLTQEGGEAAKAQEQPAKAQKPKKRKKKTRVVRLDGNENWQIDMKEVLAANLQIHQERLYPLANYNNQTDKIRITPLGGLGEIGGNMTVFETENDAIIVDVGMSFPNESMLGVDILVPDFSYIRQIQDKIRAVVITHAHEDHIGAMPYFSRNLSFHFTLRRSLWG